MTTSIVTSFIPLVARMGVGSPIASNLGICSYAEWLKREHELFNVFFVYNDDVNMFCLSFQGDYFTLFWLDMFLNLNSACD